MRIVQKDGQVSASFRDASGFVFWRDGAIYRQVNVDYKDHYDHFISSGLYAKLTAAGLVIPHEEVDSYGTDRVNVYKVIKPELIPFVSYPYEWSFSQLKDAALTTLRIQKAALGYGMVLKDSSAYNIQFRQGKPVLIDTLSFERYREGEPWVAYKQFCEHFLAPLALMSYRDIRLNGLLRIHLDGIPLDLTSALLPIRTRFRFSVLSHIHLHAQAQKKYESKPIPPDEIKVRQRPLLALIDHLEATIRALCWRPAGTEWADYYADTDYSVEGIRHKTQLIEGLIEEARPKMLWDLGANTGFFSRIASRKHIVTIAFDADPSAVEKSYLESVAKKETHLLPLLMDLMNPSPSVGWSSEERMAFIERGPADAVMALALVHHLAISNNVPFEMLSEFFSKVGNVLIIEFVPKNDSQVKRLLATRRDVFNRYDQANFEKAFSRHFRIKSRFRIKDSDRVLYSMLRG